MGETPMLLFVLPKVSRARSKTAVWIYSPAISFLALRRNVRFQFAQKFIQRRGRIVLGVITLVD